MIRTASQKIQQNTGRALFRQAVFSLGAVALSYFTARVWLPAIFPFWGVALLCILGVWSALSLRALLPQVPKTLRWVLVTVFVAAVTCGMFLTRAGYLAAFQVIPLAVVLLLISTGLSTLTSLLFRFRLLHFRLPVEVYLPGFAAVLAGVLMIAATNLRHRWTPAVPLEPVNVRDELRYLHRMDQQDRATGRFLLDGNRDKARLLRVLALDSAGLLDTPEVQYHAGLILQHGHTSQHYRRAYELFAHAAKANVPNAEALSHAAYDRWMLSIGKPQKYGTQLLVVQ